jgi:diguanylate cyclase (GGDEF)-like protein
MEVKNTDLEKLLSQLVRMIKNHVKDSPEAVDTPELDDIQSAVNYLENCLFEINQYLGHLSRGDLSVEPLSRKNYLAGNLKQLHSDLKNLTWQANQVAQGDYKQRVNFLGDFSVSFNKMVEQLEERERIMTERAEALLQSKLLLVSVVDSIKEWLFVLDIETHEVLYENLSVKQQMNCNCLNPKNCKLYADLLNRSSDNFQIDEHIITEYECNCDNNRRYLTIKTYSIAWNDRNASAFLISDIKETKIQEQELKNLAYKDELTGAYNRRYGIEDITKRIIHKDDFLLCFIDIDKLKYVNDTFGHAAGDEYIISVVNVIQACLRSSDRLCRYGGDEFVLAMENCPMHIGLQKLEDCRKKIIEEITYFPKSISFGITHITPENVLGLEDLLESSDKQMYEFKLAHRDEVAEISKALKIKLQ